MRRDADESRFFASACVHASKSAGIDTEVLVMVCFSSAVFEHQLGALSFAVSRL